MWIAFWLLRKRRLPRALLLVAASYAFYFYGTWDGRARRKRAAGRAILGAPLPGGHFCGQHDRLFHRTSTRPRDNDAQPATRLTTRVGRLLPRRPRRLQVLELRDPDSLAALLSILGVHAASGHLRLILPFGISFFTFETMSYTIDVWRGDLSPTSVILITFSSFAFSRISSTGPIVRPAQMLPQLAASPPADAAMQARGLWRIATG